MLTPLARLFRAILDTARIALAVRTRARASRPRRAATLDPGATTTEPADEALPKPPSPAVVRAMRDELKRVLDEQPEGRLHYRHLARFERKFGKLGPRAIDEVPVDQLRRALRDFEKLVRNWSSASLADLRSRMAVTLADRSSAASVWVAANSVSAVPHPWQEPMAARLVRAAGEGFRASVQGEAVRARRGLDSRHGVTI